MFTCYAAQPNSIKPSIFCNVSVYVCGRTLNSFFCVKWYRLPNDNVVVFEKLLQVLNISKHFQVTIWRVKYFITRLSGISILRKMPKNCSRNDSLQLLIIFLKLLGYIPYSPRVKELLNMSYNGLTYL